MSIDSVVVNTSPLIVLFKSGQEELLPTLFGSILVPMQVIGEIQAGSDNDPTTPGIEEASWIDRRNVSINTNIAAWNLGKGESGVFSLVREIQGGLAVVDDLAARRCAKAFGIATIGTGGLMVLAKRRGLIEKVHPRLQRLLDAGLFLSSQVVELLLDEAGEL